MKFEKMRKRYQMKKALVKIMLGFKKNEKKIQIYTNNGLPFKFHIQMDVRV